MYTVNATPADICHNDSRLHQQHPINCVLPTKYNYSDAGGDDPCVQKDSMHLVSTSPSTCQSKKKKKAVWIAAADHLSQAIHSNPPTMPSRWMWRLRSIDEPLPPSLSPSATDEDTIYPLAKEEEQECTHRRRPIRKWIIASLIITLGVLLALAFVVIGFGKAFIGKRGGRDGVSSSNVAVPITTAVFSIIHPNEATALI
ncbi:hypothetical protein BX666DRAFT_1298691 [Dichotomocladium elegans]|nr:hypothetical protein BX666DRAFT_1298691 [Dichotomocladium elegans]